MELVMRALASQWQSMASMALMFTVTILISIWIQPYHDRPESRAFGDAGTTKAGWLAIEFLAILVFTALILWLAKKKLDWIIKWGVLFILWIALSFTLVPIASYMMDAEEQPFAFRDEPGSGEMLWVSDEANSFIVDNGTHLLMFSDVGGLETGTDGWAGATPVWEHEIPNEVNESRTRRIVPGPDVFTYCDESKWMRLDANDGSLIANGTDPCEISFSSAEHDWMVFSQNVLYMDNPFQDYQANHNKIWMMPDNFDGHEFLLGRTLTDNSMLLVAKRWAGVIELEDEQHQQEFGDANVTVLWEFSPESGDHFTAATFGHSPWSGVNWFDSEDTDRLLIISSDSGQLNGFTWNGSEMSSEEHMAFNERGAFDGPIRGLMVADDWHDGQPNLWVVDGDRMRMFSGSRMVEELTVNAPAGEGAVGLSLHTVPNEAWAEVGYEDGVVIFVENEGWHSGVTYTPATEPAYIFVDESGYLIGFLNWSWIVAIVLSVVLMVLLTLYPEWYVVNTVGILTGAGVITILGVSFVPTLILFFMVVAAVYDAYAVYRSKHMLDLADTMIGLKLPILLVAPQDKGYSFLDEEADVMSAADDGGSANIVQNITIQDSVVMGDVSAKAESAASGAWKAAADSAQPPPKPAKPSGDALFMGLGDVIFPGMLVISALTFLPDGAGWFGMSLALTTGLGALIGGLVGYFVLMTYVAMGRPQAGLPLLNGGSILGYLITGVILAGSGALSFGISFF
uniref:Uncharacterized protein n=1 Tax=uncultured marine group II/III euryarchaeote KM3_05_H10 TaxID=1457839 RepID=A0A075G386_9EURY|nr:hypothetical protein, containing DUF1119 domain [uncultured marine group II/III euryarchaeote KM3_05_H10]